MEPTKTAVSVPYFTGRMFCVLNLNSFLRGYRHFIMSKFAFMISGTRKKILGVAVICKKFIKC